MHRLQWVAGTLFEAAAHEDLIDPRRLRDSVAERDKQIEELRAWCKRFAGVKASARLARRLEAERDWERWRTLFWSLNEIDAVAAADAAVRLAQRQPDRTPDMARLLVLLDRREHAGEARAWLEGKDAEQRFYASLLVLASGGDSDGACLRNVLARLADADISTVHAAVPALLACGKPEARAFLLDCLQGKGPAGFRPMFSFAQRLMRAGWVEAFTAVDEAMAKPAENKLCTFIEDDALRTDENCILRSINSWRGLRWPFGEPSAEDLAKTRAELRAWLRGEWEAVQANRPTSMIDQGLPLPWADLVEERSGWVRRF